MLRGSCLCGSASWSVDGELALAHACHCSMCRKAHGTAFGTYASVKSAGFRWTAGREHVQEYRSSASGVRPFCGRCGSAVPNPEPSGERVGLPLGPLEGHGADFKLLAHIFTGSKAPWHEITDGLQQFEAWPPGYDFPAFPTPDRGSKSSDRIAGSCLCGAVAYEVTPPLAGMRNCHCSRCRKARSAPHASNAFCNLAAFRYTKGQASLREWKVPEAQFFTQTFCSSCGSPMPRVSPERDLVVIPGGSFDDDPRVRPTEHIFVGSKASWWPITDGLPQRVERT
jgi:hypothetical protein